MAQPDFSMPDFLEDNTPEDILERMMGNLPEDIDDMPGGFPYDFTMPSAIEKSELIQFHLARALMIAFPEYAWDEWLDLHGKQVHIKRHEASFARGVLKLEGDAGTEIEAGTIFCVPSADDLPAVEFETNEACVIGADGAVEVAVTAVEAGTNGNVKAGSVSIMDEPVDEITGITNLNDIKGGSEAESDDDYYDRIAAEYDSSKTYLGNDNDYKRWAKEAGAGDCIVDAAWNGPGTVKIILVDVNGRPADQALVQKVYDYIVSPDDRSVRLLPTACADLTCVAASTVKIHYICTGLEYDSTMDIGRIENEFREALKPLYTEAKRKGVLRYNDVRPIISAIEGVWDFDLFLVNGGMDNILLQSEEYPDTGECEFS